MSRSWTNGPSHKGATAPEKSRSASGQWSTKCSQHHFLQAPVLFLDSTAYLTMGSFGWDSLGPIFSAAACECGAKKFVSYSPQLEHRAITMETSKYQHASHGPIASGAVRFTQSVGQPTASTPKFGSARPRVRTDLTRLGSSADGYPVFDRPKSHHHLTSEVLASLIRRVALDGRDFVKACVGFEHVVGFSDCVVTTDADTIVFAQRENRAGLTRFVLSRRPEPSQSVIGIFKRMVDQPGYLLVTAMVGEGAEPEPWDRNATVKSHSFWANHALVWESLQGSATGCPIMIGCPGRIGVDQPPQHVRAA